MTKQAAERLHERLTRARLEISRFPQHGTGVSTAMERTVDAIGAIVDLLIFEAIDKSDLHPETAEKYWIEEESL